MSSFYESEALPHNFGVRNCYLESRSPSLYPNTHTLTGALTATHLGVRTAFGHTQFRPHTQNTIPGWCVDSNPGSDYEGSSVGAQERGLGRPGVPTPASLLPVWLWALLHFLSLSFLTCKMRMIMVLRRVAVQVKRDHACEVVHSRYSTDGGYHSTDPSQVHLFTLFPGKRK